MRRAGVGFMIVGEVGVEAGELGDFLGGGGVISEVRSLT